MNAICSNMDGVRDRKTNTVCFHLYVESEKQNKGTNITKQKQTHRQREQIGGYQRGGGRLNGLRGTEAERGGEVLRQREEARAAGRTPSGRAPSRDQEGRKDYRSNPIVRLITQSDH